MAQNLVKTGEVQIPMFTAWCTDHVYIHLLADIEAVHARAILEETRTVDV